MGAEGWEAVTKPDWSCLKSLHAQVTFQGCTTWDQVPGLAAHGLHSLRASGSSCASNGMNQMGSIKSQPKQSRLNSAFPPHLCRSPEDSKVTK